MKRNSLTTAIIAGIAGIAGFAGLANAVDLNPDGPGQMVVYPYYQVDTQPGTRFEVVDTANVGQSVKVRFLEGRNANEVLDFNLYLSPHDVWTSEKPVDPIDHYVVHQYVPPGIGYVEPPTLTLTVDAVGNRDPVG